MANIDVTEYQIGENTYRYRDASIHEDLEGKVDKIEDYSLVPNTEITKLGTVEENANYIEVDDELSDISENPVQNKVVKGAIDELQNLATRQQKARYYYNIIGQKLPIWLYFIMTRKGKELKRPCRRI